MLIQAFFSLFPLPLSLVCSLSLVIFDPPTTLFCGITCISLGGVRTSSDLMCKRAEFQSNFDTHWVMWPAYHPHWTLHIPHHRQISVNWNLPFIVLLILVTEAAPLTGWCRPGPGILGGEILPIVSSLDFEPTPLSILRAHSVPKYWYSKLKLHVI